MTATRKIAEAENILAGMERMPDDRFKAELEKFVKTANDVFMHLLDEYNVKFNLGIQHIGLEKFKATAKKAGKIEAINFLIWYEKEYRKIRNEPTLGQFLDKDYTIQGDNSDIIKSCSELLDATRKMTYHSYENF